MNDKHGDKRITGLEGLAQAPVMAAPKGHQRGPRNAPPPVKEEEETQDSGEAAEVLEFIRASKEGNATMVGLLTTLVANQAAQAERENGLAIAVKAQGKTLELLATSAASLPDAIATSVEKAAASALDKAKNPKAKVDEVVKARAESAFTGLDAGQLRKLSAEASKEAWNRSSWGEKAVAIMVPVVVVGSVVAIGYVAGRTHANRIAARVSAEADITPAVEPELEMYAGGLS